MNWLAVLIVLTATGSAEVEQRGVCIRAKVYSSEFEWEVTNRDAPPILAVEIQQYHGYNFVAPEGWETGHGSASVTARTADRIRAIHPGQQKVFSMRVGSGGAVLGSVPVTLWLDDGTLLVLPGVWSSVPEPRWTILLVPFVLLGIGAIHSVMVGRCDTPPGRGGRY